jgi:hypothetical protein
MYLCIQAYRYLGYALSIKQLLVTSADNINQNERDELHLSLSSSQYHLAEVLLYIGSTGIYRYLYVYIYMYLPIINILPLSSSKGPPLNWISK